jgi:hypothetical protein
MRTARRRTRPAPTRLGYALLLVLLVLIGGVGLAVARADEEEIPRYEPTSRGTRPAVVQWRPLLEQYDWDVETALRVIDCESGGVPGVWNHQGSGAHGLFQLLGWEWKAYELYGVWSVADPVVNVGVAYWIWAASGGTFGTSMGWRASVGCWS